MEKIGLIAGNRNFPLLVAQEAAKQGVSVVVAAVKGETSLRINRLARQVRWFNLGEFTRMFDYFRGEGIKKVIMAGQISPHRLFSRQVIADPRIQEILGSIKDRKANTIFSGLAGKLSAAGLELIDSTAYVKDHLPEKGVLTKRSPNSGEWEDIKFGLDLAGRIAALDIGLSVGVRHKAIVAVEALEGTDNLIRRAGALARCGVVIAKAARPDQDMRFDIPVIGLATVKTLVRAKASCLAFEAGKTLFLDMQQGLALADRKKLAIVAV